jgi:hypothetical protein
MMMPATVRQPFVLLETVRAGWDFGTGRVAGVAVETRWPQLGQNAAPSGTAAPQLVQFMLKSPRTRPSGERIALIERKNKLAVTGMNPVTLVVSV